MPAAAAMMTACARPSTMRLVDTSTISILRAIVLRLVTATGEASWSRVSGLRLQSLIDCVWCVVVRGVGGYMGEIVGQQVLGGQWRSAACSPQHMRDRMHALRPLTSSCVPPPLPSLTMQSVAKQNSRIITPANTMCARWGMARQSGGREGAAERAAGTGTQDGVRPGGGRGGGCWPNAAWILPPHCFSQPRSRPCALTVLRKVDVRGPGGRVDRHPLTVKHERHEVLCVERMIVQVCAGVCVLVDVCMRVHQGLTLLVARLSLPSLRNSCFFHSPGLPPKRWKTQPDQLAAAPTPAWQQWNCRQWQQEQQGMLRHTCAGDSLQHTRQAHTPSDLLPLALHRCPPSSPPQPPCAAAVVLFHHDCHPRRQRKGKQHDG